MYLLDTNICIYIINKRSESVMQKICGLNPCDVKISSIISSGTGIWHVKKRTAYTSTDIGWSHGKEQWGKLSTIGAIHREFEKGGEKSSQRHYYISSAILSPEALLCHARLEWAVESMHWLLDVHFTEDKTRVWDMNVQKILNTTRKIALNMVRLFKSANLPERVPLTSVFKGNLFGACELAKFLDFFSSKGKLD